MRCIAAAWNAKPKIWTNVLQEFLFQSNAHGGGDGKGGGGAGLGEGELGGGGGLGGGGEGGNGDGGGGEGGMAARTGKQGCVQHKHNISTLTEAVI
eukprot:109399-Pelagomonas_calceolata.AAC.1